ncbi:hypothetical protein VPZ60_004313 [Salmonella enterica]|nr:hypothetical protein [Salmonella enterica]
MADEDAKAEAQRQLDALLSLPPILRPLMDNAIRSLRAEISGQKPKVLDWGRVMDLMIAFRPRVVTVGMMNDRAVRRAIYENGVYCAPAVAGSVWDEPYISLDNGEPMPCWAEVEDFTSPRYCETWPHIIVTKLKAAGIPMTETN